jgi:hypothetical protein
MKNSLPMTAEGTQVPNNIDCVLSEVFGEMRAEARASALAKGYTLEEEIDALEQVAGVPNGTLDSYRVLYGILPFRLN